MKKLALIGQVFGRLTVIAEGETKRMGAAKNPYRHWVCQCSCGQQCSVVGAKLAAGKTQSCGCLYRESIGNLSRTHGETGSKATKEYIAWAAMKARCYNPNGAKYAEWGGRGITVCRQWLGSYETFLADMGRAPSAKHSLDRIDVNGNYEPSNCRWATAAEQGNNKRIYKTTRSHCPQGHEYTPENTTKRLGKGRQCKTCKRLQYKKPPPNAPGAPVE